MFALFCTRWSRNADLGMLMGGILMLGKCFPKAEKFCKANNLKTNLKAHSNVMEMKNINIVDYYYDVT